MNFDNTLIKAYITCNLNKTIIYNSNSQNVHKHLWIEFISRINILFEKKKKSIKLLLAEIHENENNN